MSRPNLSIALFLALLLAPLSGQAQEPTSDARAEVLASFEALQSAPPYRTTMTVELPEGENAEFDFPPIVTEVSGGRQRSDFRLDMQGMDLRMLSVVEPGRSAARIESKALEEMQRTMDAQMAQMARQSIMSGVMGFITSGFDPFSLVGTAFNLVGSFAMQRVAQKLTGQVLELNKWKCFDQPAPSAADSPEGSLESVEPLGEESIDGTAVRVYRVVMHQGEDSMEIRLSTVGPGGLPRRMAFRTDEGAMTMDYHDFGAPIEIEFPACET